MTTLYLRLPVLLMLQSTSIRKRYPFATGYATAIDNCAGTITISYDDNRAGLNLCNATGVISRTWTATDVSNNNRTCVQTISVQDVI